MVERIFEGVYKAFVISDGYVGDSNYINNSDLIIEGQKIRVK